MKRRKFITLLGGAAAAWPLAARAQRAAMPVIGWLSPASPVADTLRAFRQGLQDTGYVEGENVAIEYRWAENQLDRLPALASELVRRQVAVIATPGGATLAAKAATTTIPILFVAGEDPVGLGLVASLARPGGNLTGVNIFSNELAAKRLELLRELMPGAARVAVLVNPANSGTAESTSRDAQAAARDMGMQVQVLSASTSREIDENLRSAFSARSARPALRRRRPAFHQPAHPTGPPCDPSRGSRCICRASISRNRRADELWCQPDGCVASGWVSMPAASSRGRSRPTYQSCSRPSSSLSSMLKRPGCSASPCRLRCSPAPTR